MEAKHTPGPWKIDEAQDLALGIIADTHDGLGICTLDPERIPSEATEEELANARLIAAAPDLLDALWALVANEEPMGDGYAKVCTLDIEAAQRIIAKAEGREAWHPSAARNRRD